MPPSKHPPHSPPRPHSFRSHPGLFLATWALTLAILPVVVPVLGALFIVRAVIRALARNAGLSDPLTPYDCIFAVDSYDSRPYASNLTVLELKSRLELSTLRDLFVSRILDDPTFSKLLYRPVEYLGYWFWKPLAHVPDISDCVRLHYDSELELGPVKTVDECLREIVEMPYRNELFNVALLHFGNKSVLVFRIHHTVCDGYSFNKLVDKFVGLESKYLVRDSRVRDWGTWARKVAREMAEIGKLLFHLPLHLAQLYRESLTHTPNYFTLPKTSTTGMIRRTVLPLAQVKAIRQGANVHFASTGMALMTGALQRFYDDNSSHPPHLRPDRLSIMHSLPRSNHPLNSREAGRREMCNWWGVGLFKIPFVRDPVGRLLGAEDDFNEYMDLQYHNLLHIHIPVVSLIPCFVVKWFFSINFGTSCGFTSVPGLFDKVAYVGGSSPQLDSADGGRLDNGSLPVEVTHMWKVFGLQWRQSAVAVAMYTYRGEASVSLYANKGDIVPDERAMDRLLTHFHEEFNALLASNKVATETTPPFADNKSSRDGGGTAKGGGLVIDAKFLDACVRNNKLA